MSLTALKSIIDDATILQRQAADPNNSIWVMASAGTGKTTVLVERFIRLVLNGTPPDKILCLTYTKAAATQMKDRILRRLSPWVQMDDEALKKDVSTLIQKDCTPVMLKKARGLMGVLLDTLDRLNIMTIHSFCQSLLARFQVEAGLMGGLDIMEDTKAREIFTSILEDILANDTSPHVEDLLRVKGEGEWPGLLNMIVNDRIRFHSLFNKNQDIQDTLSQILQINKDDNEECLRTTFMRDEYLPVSLLKVMISIDKKADLIERILSMPSDQRGDLFEDYAQIFLKKDLDQRKVSNPKDESAQTQIFNEQLRLMAAHDKLRAVRTRDMTISLAHVAHTALQAYETYKDRSGVLDYQDLIEKTVALLSLSDASEWIRYKLDGGIDQVLVDEAQDTNPLQWHIIARLIEDYFSGDSTRDPEDRTLFVVGDTKQSIFGFQGADPKTAENYHAYFSQKAKESARPWNDVPLNTSFRTAQDIIDAVDACGAWGDTKHIAGKAHAGRVELWPLIEQEKSEKEDLFWTLPTQSRVKSQKQLIDKVADRIKNMVDNALSLPSKNGAPIAPEDILILVQKRTHYPVPLIQALRQRNIPVAGIDSFALTDDIAVKDILSLLRWSLFTDDDLSLAEILKSSFVNWGDTRLGECAIGRRGTLWASLQERDASIARWLRDVKYHVRNNNVDYALQLILEMPCPASEVSGYHAVERRLGSAALDALEQLITYARNQEVKDQNALSFLQHLEKHSPRIKRELEGDNAQGVRIMTAHGAKGLEAPIVFLIDTILSEDFKRKTSDLQWIEDDNGVLYPLWATRKEDRADILDTLKSEAAQKSQDEYYRLLYVAMTRAKDMLVVAGASSAKEPNGDSWYFKVQEAMHKLNARAENDVLIYGKLEMKKAEQVLASHDKSLSPENLTVPIWPQNEELSLPEETVSCDARALYIGRQWHTLLERAIDRDDIDWQDYFAQWVEDLPDIDLETGKARLNALRRHPQYGFLFQPGGAVEVPFITSGDATPTRGRIDRLVRTDDTLWIIDYKTRLDPQKVEQMAAYQDQMIGYKAAITPISGDLPVKTVLVDIAKGEIHVI